LILCHFRAIGVLLDYKLDYKLPIHQPKFKVAEAVGILRKSRYILLKSTLLLFYHALEHLHITFGLQVGAVLFITY